MALNRKQQQVARQVYSIAVQRGVPPARARELASAALAESGLDPHATNRSSGAAGLFQLLSSGYRQTAQKLGGLYDIAANTNAILPSYKRYWAQHPNAAPGEAGRDVERSGEGAGFYSGGLAQLGFLAGGAAPGLAGMAAGYARTPAEPLGPSPDARRQFALQISASPHLTTDSLLEALKQLHSPEAQLQPSVPPTGAQEPAGAPGASSGAPSDGSPTLDAIEAFGSPYGLTVTSTTEGNHVKNSYHYQGRAADFGGDPRKMAAMQKAALANPREWTELFYTGPGAAPYYIKNGTVYPVSKLDPSVAANHRDHVHAAR